MKDRDRILLPSVAFVTAFVAALVLGSLHVTLQPPTQQSTITRSAQPRLTGSADDVPPFTQTIDPTSVSDAPAWGPQAPGASEGDTQAVAGSPATRQQGYVLELKGSDDAVRQVLATQPMVDVGLPDLIPLVGRSTPLPIPGQLGRFCLITAAMVRLDFDGVPGAAAAPKRTCFDGPFRSRELDITVSQA